MRPKRQRRSWEFRAQSSEFRIGAPRLRHPHLSRVEVERWRDLVLTAVASCDTTGINSPRPAGYRRLTPPNAASFRETTRRNISPVPPGHVTQPRGAPGASRLLSPVSRPRSSQEDTRQETRDAKGSRPAPRTSPPYFICTETLKKRCEDVAGVVQVPSSSFSRPKIV